VWNAILYVAEHGCKWRGLPKRFGNWHTIYTRMNRWSKSDVMGRVFAELQQTQCASRPKPYRWTAPL
jgi:transposase